MTQNTLVDITPYNAEPALAGTLVLMSIFRHNACPHAAQKIVQNLSLLSQRPELSAEFRDLCRRLCEDWRCIPFSAAANGPQPMPARSARPTSGGEAPGSDQPHILAGKQSVTVH